MFSKTFLFLKTYLRHSLVRNSMVYIVTNFANAAIPLFILPILTRLLSPADYGIVALYQIIQSVMVLLIGLNTHGAVTTNFFILKKHELRVYIGNVLMILFGSFVAVFSLLFLFRGIISHMLGFPENWLFLILVVSAFQFFITINLIIWQSEQRALPYSIIQIATTVMNLAMSIVFIIVLKMHWQGRILGAAITTILFGLLSLVLLYRRQYVHFSFHSAYIKDALKFGLPLIPHSLAGLLITATDRVLITAMVGISATGLYTVGYQVAVVIEILSSSFNVAWVPFLFKTLTRGDEASKVRIVKFTYLYFIAIIVFALALTIISPFLLHFLVGKQFQSSYKFILWIALAYAFGGMYYMVTNYIFFVKKTYLLAWATFGSALINVGLNYVFIKLNGAVGAAQATMLSYLITFLVVWYVSARVYKMPWNIFRRTQPEPLIP